MTTWYPPSPKVLSRRTVLRGAGGVAVALPFLDAMASRQALAQASRKKYFIPFFTPNGIVPQRWATGTEDNFQLGTILASLEPHKSGVIVIHGLNKQGGPVGDGHQQGAGTFLTGRTLNKGPFPVAGGTVPIAGWASGISADQYIANELTKLAGNKFKSLEFAVQPGGSGTVWNRISYADNDKPIAPESSPTAAVNRLFSDLNVDPAVLDRLRAQRKSVLDAVLEQFKFVSGQVGTADKAKLDSHATSIRGIEAGLSLPTQPFAACARPSLGAQTAFDSNDNFPQTGKVMMDILVMALACDLTRVASLLWSAAVSGTRFTWLGISGGHHDISHSQTKVAPTDTYEASSANEQLLKIDTWYGEQFTYLVGKLKGVSGPSGTLFDQSVVLWGNEISSGQHEFTNMPYVLAGGGWGTKMGRFLKYDNKTPLHNNLLVSAINAMGFPAVTTFGTPGWGNGPLPRLQV